MGIIDCNCYCLELMLHEPAKQKKVTSNLWKLSTFYVHMYRIRASHQVSMNKWWKIAQKSNVIHWHDMTLNGNRRKKMYTQYWRMWKKHTHSHRYFHAHAICVWQQQNKNAIYTKRILMSEMTNILIVLVRNLMQCITHDEPKLTVTNENNDGIMYHRSLIHIPPLRPIP